jgi:glutaminyl-peptide cyclotransferase
MMLRAAIFCLVALGGCAPAVEAEIPTYGYEIKRTYPHDPEAFTQGLFFQDGFLIESTGQLGRSTLRRVRLDDGVVVQKVDLPANVFGEGSTAFGDEIITVTWRSGLGFRFDAKTFAEKGRFTYPGEGWGLTEDDRRLILSDGSPVLRFFDPATMKETGRITVTADGEPLRNLNELEWVKGEIFANIWFSKLIARIDPTTGRVTGWIDLSGLTDPAAGRGPDNVLNGIAYDQKTDRLFVTGKNWPQLFEIAITPPKR